MKGFWYILFVVVVVVDNDGFWPLSLVSLSLVRSFFLWVKFGEVVGEVLGVWLGLVGW